MVTHDVGLKNFATRIVRMLDGKIQQITDNPLENRNHHIENLHKLCESYQSTVVVKDHGDTLGVRAGNEERVK